MSRTTRLIHALEGKQFNYWKVLYKLGTRRIGLQNKVYWQCLCTGCNKEKAVYGNSLVSGKSKACGCIRSNRRPKGHAALTNIYSNYRCKARRKGLVFELSEPEFDVLAQQQCFYCGATPQNVAKNLRSNGEYRYNGIDRVDNTAGYTRDNCVTACKRCNKAKLDMKQVEFFSLISTIYERHLK